MKQGPNTKRPRGGRANGRRSNFGHGQSYDSNGPEVKVSGNAWRVHEKYQALARDAITLGDRVAAENYLQHAEHYYRMLHANAPAQGEGMNGNRQGNARHGAGPEGQTPRDSGNGTPDSEPVTA